MIHHVLPSDTSGDTTWFARQNPFEQQVIRRQVTFKRAHLPTLPDSPHVNFPAHTYPHVLPPGHVHGWPSMSLTLWRLSTT